MIDNTTVECIFGEQGKSNYAICVKQIEFWVNNVLLRARKQKLKNDSN